MENKITNILYQEHEIILKLKQIVTDMNLMWEKHPQEFNEKLNILIDFCRNYADQLHHYKEEHILFPVICKINPITSGLINEMQEHHEIFRELMNKAESNLINNAYSRSYNNFRKYIKLLEDHILIENNELFPLIDDMLAFEEQERIYFNAIDYNNEHIEAIKKFEKTIKNFKLHSE